MKTNSLPALALAFTLAALSSSALAIEHIKIDITPPKEEPHLGDPPSKGDHSGEIVGRDTDDDGGWNLDPEVIGKLGPIDPGPAEPKTPGGILAVDDTPTVVILDDGVGSPGGPAAIPGASVPEDALVIRLACSFGPAGLVIRNVGDLDAPIGLKLRWRAQGLGIDGTVRLDQPLRVGHSASLGGVSAQGAGCGLRLVS